MSKPPTVCQRLFNELFIVGIPNKFLWSTNHVDRIPGLSSPDPDMNRIILNEITFVARSTIAMAMLYDKGIEVQFEKRRDMLTVYDLITSHLRRWGEIIEHPLSSRKPPPPEDLLLLEDFSNFIYADALFERATLEARGVKHNTSYLDSFFSKFGGRNRMRATKFEPVNSGNMPAPVETPIMPGSNIQTSWNNSPWSIISGNTRHSGKS